MSKPFGIQLSSLEKGFKRAFWAFAGRLAKPNPFAPFTPGPSCSALVLRPDRLGDFMLTLPAFSALQNMIGSSASLTIVAGEANESMARFCFPQAKVLVFKRNILQRALLFLELWRGRYDVMLDFHSYPFSTTSALMALVSGSPYRIGFWATGDFEEYHGLSRKVFSDGVPAPPENLHESSKSLLLLKKMFGKKARIDPGPAVLPVADPQKKARVEDFFKGVGVQKNTRLLGLHPTLQKKDNRWAPERYVELLRELKRWKNLKFIVIHGKGEREALEQFKAMMGDQLGVYYLPDDDILFIREAAKRLNALVCGDSGIMHVCSAVTRVLAVFGPSEPLRWGPLDPARRRHILFRKNDRLCDSIEPAQVARAVLKAIKP